MHQTSWPNWLATSPLIATWVLLHIGEVPLPLEVTSKPYSWWKMMESNLRCILRHRFTVCCHRQLDILSHITQLRTRHLYIMNVKGLTY